MIYLIPPPFWWCKKWKKATNQKSGQVAAVNQYPGPTSCKESIGFGWGHLTAFNQTVSLHKTKGTDTHITYNIGTCHFYWVSSSALRRLFTLASLKGEQLPIQCHTRNERPGWLTYVRHILKHPTQLNRLIMEHIAEDKLKLWYTHVFCSRNSF